MSEPVDILAVQARCECRDWMLREINAGMGKRAPIDKMIDEATGYEDPWWDDILRLLSDQADDLELLGHDATLERDTLQRLKEARSNG